MQQFGQLDEMDKVSAIMQYGHLMAQNMEERSRMFLYRFDSFYVSARYGQPDDQLKEITCFLEVNQQIPHYRKQLITINPAERLQNKQGSELNPRQ